MVYVERALVRKVNLFQMLVISLPREVAHITQSYSRVPLLLYRTETINVKTYQFKLKVKDD
jgi:hypothetical protein